MAIGNDVTISLSEVRDASLHRDISGIESDKLNPSVLVETGVFFYNKNTLFLCV